MLRRSFLKLLLSSSALSAIGLSPSGRSTSAHASKLSKRIRPSDPTWPSTTRWAKLKEAVQGRLIDVTHPLEKCADDAKTCAQTLKQLENPFYVQD